MASRRRRASTIKGVITSEQPWRALGARRPALDWNDRALQIFAHARENPDRSVPMQTYASKLANTSTRFKRMFKTFLVVTTLAETHK